MIFGRDNGTIKPVFGPFAALRIAGLGARRALKPPEITSPFFNNIGQNEKVSPRFSCLIRNLAPLPLSSVVCGLLPKRSPPSSELGASPSCASAPITSGPSRRRVMIILQRAGNHSSPNWCAPTSRQLGDT